MNSDPAQEPRSTLGLIAAIVRIFDSARNFVATLFELVTLELRRAGLALMWLVALGVIAALLFVTAWVGFMVALAFWIVSLGVTWAIAIAIVALANLLAAIVAVVIGVAMSRNLLFPATRRQLRE